MTRSSPSSALGITSFGSHSSARLCVSDFGVDSDVDVLIEFEPGSTPGLSRSRPWNSNSGGLVGREVDLRTYEDLSRYFRDRVRAEARELYAA